MINIIPPLPPPSASIQVVFFIFLVFQDPTLSPFDIGKPDKYKYLKEERVDFRFRKDETRKVQKKGGNKMLKKGGKEAGR